MKITNLGHKIHSLRYDLKKKVKSKTEAKIIINIGFYLKQEQ